MTTPTRINVAPGETVEITLPYSEVCMHMQVSGKRMAVRLENGTTCMAQLLNDDGSNFSMAVTPGEAGLYHDAAGYYFYDDAQQKLA